MATNPFRDLPEGYLPQDVLGVRLNFYKKWLGTFPPEKEILDIGPENLLTQTLKNELGLSIVNTEGDLNFGDWQPSGQYPIAFCFEVIEHVQNPLVLLREIRKRMVPGGTLYLSCPKATFRLLQMSAHFNEMDEYRLRTLFDLADCFRIEQFGTTGSNYPWFIFWRGFRPLLRAVFEKSFYLRATAI